MGAVVIAGAAAAGTVVPTAGAEAGAPMRVAVDVAVDTLPIIMILDTAAVEALDIPLAGIVLRTPIRSLIDR